ncbi:MAG: site-specific DNA-methyltransferase [Anaerolineales bacterium]|nr:site-specific DNA-methyltransferase [Anaerolineales bacterium]
MATGVPKTKWSGNNSDPAQVNGLPEQPLDVSLSYEGKQAREEILATTPAATRVLWQSDKGENRLYYGDNLPILASFLNDDAVREKVRLVYIDPPFATKSVFQSRSQSDAYLDLLAGAHYIEFIRQRLIILRELLAPDGSIYVHLDENMAFHIKIIMDEVFGSANFRNWITRKKCNPKNYTRKTYGNVADYILFYTKSDNYVWNRSYEEWTPERADKEYEYVEEETGRRYKKVPVHAPGVRNGETGKPWRGMNPPPGKHWQFPPKTLDEMDARGEIYWSPNGNPRRKVYLDESSGVPVQDIWLEFRDAHNQNIKITGYPTEKNSELLARIIEASSNPGDLVLDCFSGSGTTLDVASQLGRRWIGIDNSPEAIGTTLRRFATGLERMGDFVTQRRNSPVQPMLPNLDVAPSTVMKDFSLLTTLPYSGDLDEALKQWGNSHSL